MTNVATLWIVYIIVVIVVFLVLVIPQLFGLNFGIALFLALLIGAIVVFALSWTVNTATLSTSDKTWFNILLFVAYAVPLLVALIVLIVIGVTMRRTAMEKACHGMGGKKLKEKVKEKVKVKEMECEAKEHLHPKVSTVLACDSEMGPCKKVAETVKAGDRKVTAFYA